MPFSAPHPCGSPGCPVLVGRGKSRCATHESFASADRRARENPNETYNNPRWRNLRRSHLQAHPLCVMCQRMGRVTPATDLDHVEPHKGDMVKFWAGPFQGLCHECHSRKTATSDGGFGR